MLRSDRSAWGVVCDDFAFIDAQLSWNRYVAKYKSHWLPPVGGGVRCGNDMRVY